jgi:hypothetical protein
MFIHFSPRFVFQTIIFHKNGQFQTLLEFEVLVSLFSKENDPHLDILEIWSTCPQPRGQVEGTKNVEKI